MNKALFLDRDGTINKVVKRYNQTYKKDIDDSPFKLTELSFNSGMKEIADKAKEKGYKIIIVTNQPSILKGESSMVEYEKITTEICRYLGIDRKNVFECFHREGISLPCYCRKPLPGLILMAKGIFDVDLNKSIIVGDSWKDIAAGQAAGIPKTIFLRRKKNSYQMGNVEDEQKMEADGIKPKDKIDSLSELTKLL